MCDICVFPFLPALILKELNVLRDARLNAAHRLANPKLLTARRRPLLTVDSWPQTGTNNPLKEKAEGEKQEARLDLESLEPGAISGVRRSQEARGLEQLRFPATSKTCRVRLGRPRGES